MLRQKLSGERHIGLGLMIQATGESRAGFQPSLCKLFVFGDVLILVDVVGCCTKARLGADVSKSGPALSVSVYHIAVW